MTWLTRYVVAAALAAGATTGVAAAQEACKLEAIGAGNVAAVRDGRTLMLRDGRELRLAAIETPGATQAEAARATLATLASANELVLKRLGANDGDRYGRVVAFAFPLGNATSLQQSLLEQGLARVSSRIGDKTCADALLASERAARAAGRGIWGDPNFAPLPADHLARLAAERGHFTLVEGKVLSVRESGSTIYMNFGRRWTRDFTIIVAARQKRAFAAAGVEPKTLEGKRIRVRGWIEQRGGPVIEAAAPEQIEFIN